MIGPFRFGPGLIMRLMSTAFAVALLSAAAFSSPAQAYCRGCAVNRHDPAATAAAAAAGAVYGTAIMSGAAAQAYEPPPDSSAAYQPAATGSKAARCANGASRSWSADSSASAQSESCD
jgi:hypothetical protein